MKLSRGRLFSFTFSLSLLSETDKNYFHSSAHFCATCIHSTDCKSSICDTLLSMLICLSTNLICLSRIGQTKLLLAVIRRCKWIELMAFHTSLYHIRVHRRQVYFFFSWGHSEMAERDDGRLTTSHYPVCCLVLCYGVGRTSTRLSGSSQHMCKKKYTKACCYVNQGSWPKWAEHLLFWQSVRPFLDFMSMEW